MKRIHLGLNVSTMKTRKWKFLEQTDKMAPWRVRVAPHYWLAKTARPSFAEMILRVHYLQQSFGLSDPALEEALHNVPLSRVLVVLDGVRSRRSDKRDVLPFRRLLEELMLAPDMLRAGNDLLIHKGHLRKTGTVVGATFINAPSNTKNAKGDRDWRMHQIRKGTQWGLDIKAHIGVDAESGLVHSVVTTAANVKDETQADILLCGQESDVLADAGCQGLAPRNTKRKVNWHIAMRPGKCKAPDPNRKLARKIDQAEQIEASSWAMVEHTFRVLKHQFSYSKVRNKGLAKNTAQTITPFALTNLWVAHPKLMAGMA